MFFVLFTAALCVAHAKVCENLKFVVKPDAGFDKQYCIAGEDQYDSATISGGAYVALKNKGSFPYNFEAGLQVGAQGGSSNFRITAVIGSDLTNDDENGICLHPYVALRTPVQKMGSVTVAKAYDTGRMNLFGDDGIFGGSPLCAPQGSIEWCLRDAQTDDFKYVPQFLGLMGASVCISLESVIIDGTGGAFRLQLGINMLHEAIFRVAVQENCNKPKNTLCNLWALTGGSHDKEKAIDEMVAYWVKGRDKIFDKDHIEFTKSINLGKMIKNLVDRQAATTTRSDTTTSADAGANVRRRRLGNDDIKDDGALCFGDCQNYESVVSAAVPVVAASALVWAFAIFIF